MNLTRWVEAVGLETAMATAATFPGTLVHSQEIEAARQLGESFQNMAMEHEVGTECTREAKDASGKTLKVTYTRIEEFPYWKRKALLCEETV